MRRYRLVERPWQIICQFAVEESTTFGEPGYPSWRTISEFATVESAREFLKCYGAGPRVIEELDSSHAAPSTTVPAIQIFHVPHLSGADRVFAQVELSPGTTLHLEGPPMIGLLLEGGPLAESLRRFVDQASEILRALGVGAKQAGA